MFIIHRRGGLSKIKSKNVVTFCHNPPARFLWPRSVPRLSPWRPLAAFPHRQVLSWQGRGVFPPADCCLIFKDHRSQSGSDCDLREALNCKTALFSRKLKKRRASLSRETQMDLLVHLLYKVLLAQKNVYGFAKNRSSDCDIRKAMQSKSRMKTLFSPGFAVKSLQKEQHREGKISFGAAL